MLLHTIGEGLASELPLQIPQAEMGWGVGVTVGVIRKSPKLHLHQKSTCWKLLGMMRSRFPFSFLGSTSMTEGSGLLELARTGASRESTKPSE